MMQDINRRRFISSMAAGALIAPNLLADKNPLQIPAKAKRVIYLFQSGGPSQLDLFDHKPELHKQFGKNVPSSVYPEERKTKMSSGQASFPTAPSKFKFSQHGQSGTWFSELLPNIASIADDLCVIKSMHTEAINHDPAITFFQSGSQLPGRPSIGAWLNYALASKNKNLPAFVAMSSKGSGGNSQPLYDRLWGSGFLPTKYQGVKFRNVGAPVLDVKDPPGVSRELRREMLNALGQLNKTKYEKSGDPEIQTRIAQYELAYRMQESIPELTDLSKEKSHTFKLYGEEARTPGTYAYNCLMARRLAERDVGFIQLFHQGWDHHASLPSRIVKKSRETEQATAGLIKDLKARGMLDDTLIVWGGEFGRTVYSQGKLTKNNYGRDHHPSCFSMFMAGAGVKGGMSYGETDDYSVNVVKDRVEVHDLHATILHLLGIDHKQLTYKFQGRRYRLTDVFGKVVNSILS
jgi:uncharacterized protein (DUF1501 family)